MFYYTDAVIEQLAIHRVGNKLQDEFYVLSEKVVDVSDGVLSQLLMHYFLSPFAKLDEVYRLSHPSNTRSLNEVFHFSNAFFSGELEFLELSQQLSKHLFEVSNHPNIKGGELYIVHLRDVQLEGEVHEAIGIFKSENKEAYLKVLPVQGAFDLDYEQEAININKLDKGCLIINSESD